MAAPLEAASKEFDRLWEAVTDFDSRVLQFVSVIAAGLTAGIGLAVGSFQSLDASGAAHVASLGLAAGFAFMSLFLILAVRAVLSGHTFRGPFSPDRLPDWLKSGRDQATLEREYADALARAFTDSLDQYHGKWKEFRIALRWFYAGLIVLALAGAFLVASERGEKPMREERPTEASTQLPVSPSPEQTEQPIVVPYEIIRELPPDTTRRK